MPPQKPLFKMRTEIGFTLETNVIQDGIRWGKSANFTQTPILNRSSPVITYSNSNPVMLNVNLNLYVESEENKLMVVEILESIAALTYPVDPGIQPPTLCYITLPGFISPLFNEWPCVVPSFEATHGNHNMWTKEGYPMTGVVGIQFMGVEIKNNSAKDIVHSNQWKLLSYRGTGGVTSGDDEFIPDR